MINWLRLVRLPNTFTALADVLVGKAMDLYIHRGHSNSWSPTDLLILGPMVMLLYAFGIVLNDLRDLPSDRQKKPDRILPAGKLNLKSVRNLMVLLPMVAALGLFVVPSATPAFLLILVAVFAYDVVFKGTPGARYAMALCRVGSLALGMAGAPSGPWPEDKGQLATSLVPFVAVFILVLWISRVSEWEDRNHGPRRLFWFVLPFFAHTCGAILGSSILLLGAGAILSLYVLAPLWDDTKQVGESVRRGVFTLPLHGTLVALGAGSPTLAGGALCCWLLTSFTAARLRQHES